MREVFFNSFKEKILNGQVPNMFDVHGTPVTSDFIDIFDNDEIKLEQYKTLDDFNKYAKGNDTKTLEQTTFRYEEFGVEYSAYYNNDVSEKPIFVNPDNWEKFLQTYSGEIGYADPRVKSKFDQYIYQSDENINSGFYYIQKKSQLKWISERCNDKDNFNNRIIVVMGDDIGNPAEGYQLLDTVICNDPNRPFQGILDFNGHRITNVVIDCKENSNGVIGYLGGDGVVKDAIVNNIRFKCSNKISLDKIRNDCSDVVVGGLVGTNWGTVNNIITSGDIQFNGFCPEVYLASNKYEYSPADNVWNNTNYNCFFPSKFCINSLYNVIPYVGYFAEGADSYFNDVSDPRLNTDLSNTSNTVWYTTLAKRSDNNLRALLGVRAYGNYVNSRDESQNYLCPINYNLDHFSEINLANSDTIDRRTARATDHIGTEGYVMKVFNNYLQHSFKDNVGFCDVFRIEVDQNNVFNARNFPPIIPMEDDQNFPDIVLANTIGNLGTVKTWNNLDEQEIGAAGDLVNDDLGHLEWEFGTYITKQIRDEILLATLGKYNQQVTIHQKMNPYSRIAYYCSPIVGNNFGEIKNIDCRHTIREAKDTFVGFIGNICGKQNCGDIHDISSTVDIVPLSEKEAETSPLMSRVYTDNRTYTPDYPESYTNEVNVFAYNWDYYQSPHGITREADRIKYSATSADAIRASDRFYTFHDIVASGVQVVKDDDLDEYVVKDTDYVFNMIDRRNTPERAQEFCNFKLPGYETEDSATIGSGMPEALRNAKLRFGIDDSERDLDGTALQSFAIKAELPVDIAAERSTFKLYNPYTASKDDNIYECLKFDSAALSDAVRNLSSPEIEHMDLSYLGDAAKGLSEKDPIGGGWRSQTKANGDPYVVTLADVLEYCPAFSGVCGKTKNNALDFVKNIMNAKVAVGCELLANPTLNPDAAYPGGTQPWGGNNDGWFGTNNCDIHQGHYYIPAHTGPNDTGEDWDLGDNLPDFCWFMQPGEQKVNAENGPIAFDNHVYASVCSGYQQVLWFGSNVSAKLADYNTSANRPNYFCSINERAYWDLYGTSAKSSSSFTNEVMYNGKNYYDYGNAKTMLTVIPRDNSSIDQFGEYIASVAEENDGFLDIVGEDGYTVKVNKISIPIANRTQNAIYMSSAMNGNTDVSGVFLDYERQDDLWDYDRESDGTIKPNARIKSKVVETTEEDILGTENVAKAGNIDYMYVDMSIIVEEDVNHSSGPRPEGHDVDTYRVYPMIAKIPVQRLRIPISAVEDTYHGIYMSQYTDHYTEDLANYVPGTVGYKYRSMKYYHLIPAYDMEDKIGEEIEYKLKSIYNIGGIAGMINHCVSWSNRGEYSLYESEGQEKVRKMALSMNPAYCGSITNCFIKFTENAEKFINRSLLKKYDGTKIEEFNDRSIAIANKFGGVAAIYEYRQNDIGTSPWCNILKCGPDTLENLLVQKFIIQNIYIGGHENFYSDSQTSWDDYQKRALFKIFTKVFSPVVEWANIGNILDTTNFFLMTDLAATGVRYRAKHSSNFPIGSNIFPAYSVNVDDWMTGQGPEVNNWLLASAHPVVDYNQNWYGPFDYSKYFKFWNHNIIYGVKHDSDETDETDYLVRAHLCKTYDLLPSVLLNPVNIWYYGDFKDHDIHFPMHMSPAANAPCSDYNDVYMQMFGGNPNFVNRKLSKPIMNAELHNADRIYSKETSKVLSEMPIRPELQYLLDAFNARYEKNKGITDRYFTWDYDMKNVRDLDRDKMPLDFTIRYGKDKKGVRGLWIHQNDKYIEENPWIQYAMKGKKYCMNDGSNIHLGYLPSDWSIIELLNRENENDEDPNMQFEEGRAIEGDDFRGILLSDENRDLVAFIDGGYGRDLVSGCYIAQLPKKNKFDGDDKNYGLLTEIKVEN